MTARRRAADQAKRSALPKRAVPTTAPREAVAGRASRAARTAGKKVVGNAVPPTGPVQNAVAHQRAAPPLVVVRNVEAQLMDPAKRGGKTAGRRENVVDPEGERVTGLRAAIGQLAEVLVQAHAPSPKGTARSQGPKSPGNVRAAMNARSRKVIPSPGVPTGKVSGATASACRTPRTMAPSA